MSTRSLWWRALVALALMIGFYVLSISLSGARIQPFTLVTDLASEKISSEAWQETCMRLGVETLDLGEVCPPPPSDDRACPQCGVGLEPNAGSCAACGATMPEA